VRRYLQACLARRSLLVPWAVAALTQAYASMAWADFVEPPMFAAKVAQGKLPAVAKRLPRSPRVLSVKTPGSHGGELRLLMAKTKDVRMMVVYGYARLVGYTPEFEIVPDILERIEVEGDRVFTLYLRAGHKWSDGNPFTGEDFRYWWEDIANNRELSPFGIPKSMLVDGKPPTFSVIDATTVRYNWQSPNPFFLPALAGARPLYIYSPAHYLKQFHARYARAEVLAEQARAIGLRDWSALHARMDAPYQNNNPNFPTLQPWVNTTKGPADRFVFLRNPYYHRVDQNGLQLPYIDSVSVHIADAGLISAKTGAGESDLQARYISFSDYTFLKKSEKRTQTYVRLWETTKGSHIALYPNLNVNDPVWRRLVRDVRFRRALSLAINRHEINQVLYYGLAIEGDNTVNPKCPLYRPEYRKAWAEFNIKKANKLLDELGLRERDSYGIRLLPDGRPMIVVVETAGESTEQTDVLELIQDSWIRAGIKLFSKPLQREVFRNRVFSGKTLVSVWSGLENALVTADMSPQLLAPVSQQQLQWPKWGQYHETGGAAGQPVPDDMPLVQELVHLNNEWISAPSFKAREQIWHRMLAIHADQIYSIGLISGVPQPVVVKRNLRNVPKEGVYNWDPGAYFGVYKPDTFWFAGDDGDQPQETASNERS
jgi:peptide/nickel transport system substrate-binding protein